MLSECEWAEGWVYVYNINNTVGVKPEDLNPNLPELWMVLTSDLWPRPKPKPNPDTITITLDDSNPNLWSTLPLSPLTFFNRSNEVQHMGHVSEAAHCQLQRTWAEFCFKSVSVMWRHYGQTAWSSSWRDCVSDSCWSQLWSPRCSGPHCCSCDSGSWSADRTSSSFSRMSFSVSLSVPPVTKGMGKSVPLSLVSLLQVQE